MIKFRTTTNRGPLLMLGLSHLNLEKLKAGKPIPIDLAQFSMEGTVLLFAGETEEHIINELSQQGYIEPKAAATMIRSLNKNSGNA